MIALFSLADAAAGFLVGIPLVFIIIIAVLSIFWLWMLVDALTNSALNGVEKIVWVLVVFFLHILGALLYFFLARNRSGAAGV